MNHLAHALLAGDDDALRLGSLMGDFVRGRPDPALPPGVAAGIGLHRAIDSFTDAHEQVRAARVLLPPPYRRYAGILLDMWFDHLLARDFGRWSPQPIDDYSAGLRHLLAAHEAELPEGLRRFARYMGTHDLPAAYAEPGVLGQALGGIGQRLRRSNPLHTALPVLQAMDDPLQQHFDRFFPVLQGFAAEWIQVHG